MIRRLTLVVLAAVMVLPACDSLNTEPRPDCHMVLLYSASYNNGLSSTASQCLQSLKCEYLPEMSDPSKVFLTYYHLDATAATLARLSRNDKGEFIEERLVTYPSTTNSIEPETLTQILSDARRLFPSNRSDLILSTHGTGFVPVQFVSIGGISEANLLTKGSDIKALGPEDNTCIDIKDFTRAIQGTFFDNIIFDCCFMSGIEVAYELKEACNHIIAAPTEVVSAGMTQPVFLDILFNADQERIPGELCKVYMDAVRTNPAYSKSGTVTAIDCSNLENVASACKEMFSTCRKRLDTLNINSIQKYFRGQSQAWFYDLDDFVFNLASDRDSLVHPELYENFTRGLGEAVIYKDATDEFLGLKITHYSGVSSYIPDRNHTGINEEYKSLAWNKATGLVY